MRSVDIVVQDRIFESFSTALSCAERSEVPYRHWFISNFFPDDIIKQIQTLPLPTAGVGDLSGKREYHNTTRHYFDTPNIKQFECVADIARAFQEPRMIRAIENFFTTDLEGTFLRIEYAQDLTGFWLEPHTDLGVKRITFLIYASEEPEHASMGTDIYNADKTHAKRSPFAANTAMAFVPGDATYHGFEPRKIPGIRKSLILNYVTTDWRDREQLCFPNEPVSSAGA